MTPRSLHAPEKPFSQNGVVQISEASPAGGGVWAQARAQAGNLEIWDPEIWKFEIQKNPKNKNPHGPIWGHLGPFFAWAGKMQKICNFCLFSAIHPVWGPCCYPPEVGLLVFLQGKSMLLMTK